MPLIIVIVYYIYIYGLKTMLTVMLFKGSIMLKLMVLGKSTFVKGCCVLGCDNNIVGSVMSWFCLIICFIYR